MVTFADDFNRADGPIGNGWTQSQGTWTILSGEARCNNIGVLQRTLSPSNGYQRVEASMPNSVFDRRCMEIVLKAGAGAGTHYRMQIGGTSQNKNCIIDRYLNGAGLRVASQGFTLPASGDVLYVAEYNAGQLSIWVDGVLRVTGFNDDLAAYDGMGLRASIAYCRANWVTLADAPAVAFDAEPEPLVDMAIPEEVQFTGEGTAWEPGTPGQPIFEVDKGTLDSQTVTSATTAAAMYTPPQAEDTATFTDPSTGLTDQIALSTGFQVSGGGSGKADEYFEVLEAGMISPSQFLAIIEFLNTLFPGPGTSDDLLKAIFYGDGDYPGTGPTLLDLVMNMGDITPWRAGDPPPPAPDKTIRELVEDISPADLSPILDELLAIRTDALYTLASAKVWSDDQDTDHLIPIKNQLDEIQTPADLNLQDIRDDVYGVQGPARTTLDVVYNQLQTIRTANGWTFGSVYSWITAAATSLSTIMSAVSQQLTSLSQYVTNTVKPAIDAIGGADHVDLTEIHDQVGQLWIDIQSAFGAVASAIAGVRGASSRDLTQVYDAILALPQTQVSLQPVLDAISALSDKIDALSFGPVLWPGAAGVDFGEPIALGGEQTIVGPMDGAVIEIIGSGEGKSRYGSGDWTNKYRMGWYMFVGSGDWVEDFRWLGPNRQVLTPQRLLTASKLVLYSYPGVTGTITPWTLKVA